MKNASQLLEVGQTVDIVRGTHKTRAGRVQSITPCMVYVRVSSDTTVRVWKDNVKVRHASTAAPVENTPPPYGASLKKGQKVDIVSGIHATKRGTVHSLTRCMVYVKLSTGDLVRIMQDNVCLASSATAQTPSDGQIPADIAKEDKYVVGHAVRISRHRDFFTGEIYTEEGKKGDIKKVTRCFVWVQLCGTKKTLMKRKHNVTLLDNA